MPSKIAPKSPAKKPKMKENCNCEPARGVRKSHLATKNGAAKSTRIIVKCNCGFPNNLYIRGEGIKGLSWERGTLMKCTKADEWVWETDLPFTRGKIKILVNDKQYEQGENHDITCGKSISFQPKFS